MQWTLESFNSALLQQNTYNVLPILAPTFQNPTQPIENYTSSSSPWTFRKQLWEYTYRDLNESIGTCISWAPWQLPARQFERFASAGKARKRIICRESLALVPKCIRLFRTFRSRTKGARYERKILLAGGESVCNLRSQRSAHERARVRRIIRRSI